jgi:hypothetical protein
MKKILPILCLSLFISGCGINQEEQNTKTNENHSGYGIVAGEITSSLVERKDSIDFVIKNQTEFVQTFTYSSGKLFDYEIIDSNGKVIKKGSDGMMYTQALKEISLKQGEEYKLGTIDINDLKPGVYMIKAWSKPIKHSAFKITKKITKD